ncbi:cytochrome b5 domain protein [Ancylostoma caninum]|uniref:Cytochrome b5 domain protein n=1 Tax=Ancylostoma caninum TaxID=29170 RepID=A0A368FSC9_ANCCA|nr:cytochrome b5 domain protein [Ancylostoma caninum]
MLFSTGAMAPTLTRKEVSQHNTNKSAWFVVGNKVYDVTKFLDEISYREIRSNSMFVRGSLSRKKKMDNNCLCKNL